jgi:hypothetical protein
VGANGSRRHEQVEEQRADEFQQMGRLRQRDGMSMREQLQMSLRHEQTG